MLFIWKLICYKTIVTIIINQLITGYTKRDACWRDKDEAEVEQHSRTQMEHSAIYCVIWGWSVWCFGMDMWHHMWHPHVNCVFFVPNLLFSFIFHLRELLLLFCLIVIWRRFFYFFLWKLLFFVRSAESQINNLFIY